MRIRTQIGLTAVVILSTLALTTATALHQQRGRTELMHTQTELDRLLRGAQELGTLSGELLLYPSERVRQQWRTRATSFFALLDKPFHCLDANCATLLDAIRGEESRLLETFDRLVALGSAGGDSARDAQFRVRLAPLLLTTNHDISALLRDLNWRERDAAIAELRQAGHLVVFVNLAAFALTALLLWLLWRNLSRPLAQLSRGIDRVGAGAMEYRVDNGRRDELGELARGFDRMTERVGVQTRRLRDSQAGLAVANRELEQKIAERTAELDQANDKLEQAVRQLYDAGTELAHSERLVTLGKLVASVSHELNNPLMGALNYVQHVRIALADAASGDALTGSQSGFQSGFQPGSQSGPQSGPQSGAGHASLPGAQPGSQSDTLSQWLVKAEREILRASRVTENLLSFGRKRRERRSAIPPAELVDSTLELAAPALHRNGVVADNQVPQNLRPVFGQRELLRQVLLNVILNANDALKDATDKRILIGGRAAKHRIELFVQDTGAGVPESIRDRIFEPFFTTKPKGQGTGLGLSIARRLIEGGGGTLNYVPQEVGGRFVLRLPPVDENPDNGDTLLSVDTYSMELSTQHKQVKRG